jgi:hypothetical protein
MVSMQATLEAVTAMALAATLAGCAHRPPLTPEAPSGPDAGMSHELLRFAVATTDPSGDSIAYRFSWGDGDTSDWSGYYAPGDSHAQIYAWQALDIYGIRAQAQNRSGAISDWSPPHPVSIETICRAVAGPGR